MICGVDEAGKGSVLGPMVVAAVGCMDMDDLIALGVADSKKVSPKHREKISIEIKAKFPFSIVIREADEIDDLRRSMTMNEIVARSHAEALSSLNCKCAYVDACDVNEKRYGETVSSFSPSGCTIISRHKADSLFPPVSAASIIAKVERDRIIEELSQEYGDIGSGYPSDPITVAYLTKFIRHHGHSPGIARSSWETVKNLLHQKNQSSLLDF
ncbi:ribonuclease HII [Methanospirillum sp.]|jgi:ribonuclease HII|uniref:ribonuclease HII n=1 Tax=Methanospirillum sp. TaxID=45200 RepID=UPI001BD2A9B4|nr:ribonuclease HII [Methanospirillum sp.]